MSESSYSPRLRTGVLLCGTGTAGVYHAGVLKALTEAGIKIDVLAAHGAGVVTALSAAIDGGTKLWDPAGPWTSGPLRRAYRWRAALRFAALGLIAAALILVAPALVLMVAALVYAGSVGAALVGLTGLSAELVSGYARLVEWLFNPPVLPTALPRALVLAVMVIAVVLGGAALRAARQERSRRRWRGAFWWHLVGAPLEASEPEATFVDVLWALVRGASDEPRPVTAEIGRRYVDVLADNFGQPGFHEVLVAVHDLDARRDLVGAVLTAPARAAFEARREAGEPREAEAVDFTGPQRELVVSFLQGALRLPVVTPPAVVAFPAESFWRGERHRVCDRPELAARLIDELAGVGVEQVILVSPAARPAAPHGMRPRPVAFRARIGELVRSVETAALSDAWTSAAGRFSGVFVVRPDHNPIGPFDFGEIYDESSDRRHTVRDLIAQGYADAYRLFIEPVAAAGDRSDVEHETLTPRL
jgi:hypothetical protein